jgi:hypothetical protein
MRKKTYAPVPRIAAKTITVGKLLKKIRKLILEEPKRLDMRDWVKALSGNKDVWTKPSALPACGTVACMAGWGAVLLRPTNVERHELSRSAESVLTKLIGFNRPWWPSPITDGLFSNSPRWEFGEVENYLPKPGTKASWCVGDVGGGDSDGDFYRPPPPRLLSRTDLGNRSQSDQGVV